MHSSSTATLRREDLTSLFSRSGEVRERIGLEIENAVVDPDTGRGIPYSAPNGIRDLLEALLVEFDGEPLRDDGHLTGLTTGTGMTVTLEHGGALEYASAPTSDLATAVADMRHVMGRFAEVAGRFGHAVVPGANLPFDRLRDVSWVPKPRGAVMREHFDRLGEDGAEGPVVMALTLSTQTTLDYTSAEDLAEKLRVQVAASPVVSALFVNSPLAGGEVTGLRSRRRKSWLKADPSRCGLLRVGLREAMAVDDFVEWALAFPMIYRRTAGGCHPAGDRPFGAVLEDGFPDGSAPTWDDWLSHLSQLWTDVRVRGTLELRAPDGPPYPHIPAVPALWVGLTYHRPSRLAAWDLLRGCSADALEHTMRELPVKGLSAMVGDVPARELGGELVRLAREGLAARVEAGLERPEVLGYLDPIEEVVATGTTFADHVVRRWEGEFDRDPAHYVAAFRV
ncbi:glutamate-cysteine ligase family protein [Saccharothrix sp. NRRL B-16314]|uniref:glutamate-cysteine ligase family protein n=1 Tax=Saccharothrix sp. NRRL B-16314 TaxID=1463825 RepID=UPI000527A37B|nr:glutamate-cysteine ligase family protein [Saccharothrix sp. NRRL B-16314]